MCRHTTTRRVTLLFAAVVCLSAFASGGVAAEDVTISNPTEGETGDHEWNTTVSGNGTLEYLIVNYSGTGADLQNSGLIDEEITVNGNTVSIEQTSQTSSTINATLDSSVSISSGDRIEFTAFNIDNPSSDGTYSASVELNNTSSTFASSSESFEIVQGGYVNGTVTNESDSNLTTASVSIFNNSTDEYVTGYGVDPITAAYSARIPAGEYRFRYSDDGYITNETVVSVTTGGNVVQNATLEQAAVLNGTVTNESDSVLGSASVTVFNNSTGNYVDGSPVNSSTGEYSIDLPSGEFRVEYTADGYLTNETVVSMTSGAETEQNATLERAAVLNGTVTDESGSALGSASVNVFNNSTGNFVDFSSVDPNTGEYSIDLPTGEFRVEYTADGYATNSTVVSVTSGTETEQNATLIEAGYLNGTVTDQDGTPLSGIQLFAESRTGTDTGFNETASDGSFSFELGPGRYDIVAANNPDYEFTVESNFSVTSGGETTATVTLTELPDKGTISGRLVDEDGNGVSGKEVQATDASFQYYNFTTTNATGHFSMKVPEETYRLRANSSPSARLSGVSVTANEESSVELTVPERAYLTGQVTNSSGPVPRAVVIADNGDNVYVNETNSSGHYNITAPPDEYAVTVFVPGQTAATETATVESDGTNVTNFTAESTTVTHQSVSIVNGPGDEKNLSTRAAVRGGLLQVQLVDDRNAPSRIGPPGELETLAVTDQTEFEINVTVTNFSADSLLWAIDEAEFSTTQSATDPDATNITIRGNATTLQANFTSGAPIGPVVDRDPSDIQWPTDRSDRADDGRNQTVYTGIFDFSATPGRFEDSLNGASVTTNAQAFSAPSVRNETLRIWIGGPSKTVEGDDYTGFYQATIPDSQLDAWGVDDPEEDLQTFYKGSQTDFTVEETDNGARIRLENISYSAGFVEVEANPSSDSGSSSSSSSGSSSSSSTSGPSSTASVSEDRVQLSIDNARAGEAISVSVPNSPAMDRTGVRMRSVELTLTGSGDGSLDIDTADEPSQATPEDTEPLFAYGVTTDLTDDDIDRATVQMTVQRDRVDDAASVTALRRAEGADEWETVDTTLIESDDGELVYNVETTEFSEFALVEQTTATATEEPTATPTATEEPTATDEPTATQTEPSTPGPDTTSTTQPGFGVVIAVVALLISAVLARRRS